MQTENRLFDDLARLATGAVGSLTGLRQEIETRVREQFERLLSRIDLVTREEFDAVQAMAAKARLEQEQIASRLAAIEGKLGLSSTTEDSVVNPFPHSPSQGTTSSPEMIDVSEVLSASPGIV